MRHALHSAAVCLVSALLVAGLTTVFPANAHGATEANGIWAWGDNEFGLVGDGTTELRNSPVRVQGLADVSSITHYWRNTYAVKTDGTVWRWGGFYDGLTEVTLNTPTQVSGLSGVKAIATEQFSVYAVRSDGTVWAWEYLNAPAPVAGLTDVASVSLDVHGSMGYALKQDGTVWQFGWPGVARLDGIDTVSSLTRGYYDDGSDTQTSWYAVKSDGTVWAWGDNRVGQLGDGTTTDSAAPVRVSGLTGVAKVTASDGAAYAVTTGGAVWAWGANGGQLGDGTTTDRPTPVQLPVLSQVAEVIHSGDFDMMPAWYARTTGGLVYYWGCGYPWVWNIHDEYDRCGKVPIQLPGLTGVRAIAAHESTRSGGGIAFNNGNGGGYAVKNDGTLWVWGLAHENALRYGGLEWDWTGLPVRVSTLSGVNVTAVFPYEAGAYAIGTEVTYDSYRGAHRYETAQLISQAMFPTALPAGSGVVVAPGETFQEALCGAPLAAAYGGPVLLTPGSGLENGTKAELQRLAPTNVFVIGLSSTIAAAVQTALPSATVVPINGANVYQMSNMVAEALDVKVGDMSGATAIITVGTNFPDAIGVSPLACANLWPVILTDSPTNAALHAQAVDALASLGITKALKVGTYATLPGTVSGLANLSGANRYVTNSNVAIWAKAYAGLTYAHTALTTGDKFPDALAAGPYLAADHGMLLLSPLNGPLPVPIAALITANRSEVQHVSYIACVEPVIGQVKALLP